MAANINHNEICKYQYIFIAKLSPNSLFTKFNILVIIGAKILF